MNDWKFAVVFCNDSEAEPIYFMDPAEARQFMRDQAVRETVLYRRGGEIVCSRSPLYGWKEWTDRPFRPSSSRGAK
jgi:hypothetical protein